MTLEFAEPTVRPGVGTQPDRALSVHYLTVLRLCMRQLGDVCDAEDATQETFRRAIQQGDGVVGDPLPWLIAVARNICIDELRRRRSGRTALERTAAQTVASESDGAIEANPERVVVGRMFVGEFMGKLTPAERRVVTSRLMDGVTGGELAASVGVTASTTRVLLARAREKLRRFLEEGQGVATGLCFAGWHGFRRRALLSRGWLVEPRLEMLLPPLVAGAILGAAGAPAAVVALAAPSRSQAAAARPADLAAAGVAGRSETAAARALAVPLSSPPLAAQGNGSTPAPPEPGAQGLFPAPDPNKVAVTDFEPSPDYQSDHTVYLIGAGNCLTPCSQMFRSSDGGASWTYVPTQNLQSTTLVLPPASFGSGRFFAVGGNLLQVTDDHGGSFHEYGPAAGYASAAPAWLGAEAVTADVGLSFIDSSQAPHLVTLFGPGKLAASAPLLLPSAGGFAALQLVQDEVMGGPDTLLRCTPAGCTAQTQVPLHGNAQLIPSPDFGTDHTLVALGAGVAVSHDDGASFELVSKQPVLDAIAVRGPAGERLLAQDPTRAEVSDAALAYSDDLGRTWHTAGFDQSLSGALYAHSPRALAPGRLIASAVDPRHSGMHVFVCSSDGTTWSACRPVAE